MKYINGLLLIGSFVMVSPILADKIPVKCKIANSNFELEVYESRQDVHLRLYDKKAKFAWSDSPYFYHAIKADEDRQEQFTGLKKATVELKNGRICITGSIAGLELKHIFSAPRGRPYIQECLELINPHNATVKLVGFKAGMRVKVADQASAVAERFAGDHLMALPFLHRATDPIGTRHDYTIDHILNNKGFLFEVSDLSWSGHLRIPSGHYIAEGWAWRHGKGMLGIFSFNQENLMFSFITPQKEGNAYYLYFGGACKDSVCLTGLERIEPLQKMELAMTRYQYVTGDYNDCAYAYREMLDELSCHFPADYNPPVHWNQLYNMTNAWNNRKTNYTLKRVLGEAGKACAYSCESLYLDPGWDTTFGSFIWGTEWLGKRKNFITLIEKEYGMKVALHCPMPPWASNPSLVMGPYNFNEWPVTARLKVVAVCDVPIVKDRCRNLALLPPAKATALGVLPHHPLHKIKHLNDGKYGNKYSWISNQSPTWAQIDLGAVYEIGSVSVSNDNNQKYHDRSVTNYAVLVSNKTDAHEDFKEIVRITGEPLQRVHELHFPPIRARYVRVVIDKTQANDFPRLDEISIYEAYPSVEAHIPRNIIKFETAQAGARICMGSKQFLDEAEKRLLALCADGVAFLMFDGTWWNGPCFDKKHGHPIPYLLEDHISTCVELAQRIHRKYPKVLIEMHDMLTGGHWIRATPVYYKYGLPGSYDENWAFELMWRPMKNIKDGRSLAMYYYNLACNVPLYLHINLSTDNEYCLSFWWYASTARHLGIGGDHPDLKVSTAQKTAMKKYIELEEYYKRGDFFGIDEHIHIHALAKKNALVVNCFNLSGTKRVISGQINLQKMSFNYNRKYKSDTDWACVEDGKLIIKRQLPAWGCDLAEITANSN